MRFLIKKSMVGRMIILLLLVTVHAYEIVFALLAPKHSKNLLLLVTATALLRPLIRVIRARLLLLNTILTAKKRVHLFVFSGIIFLQLITSMN